jgi:hypothetical protein
MAKPHKRSKLEMDIDRILAQMYLAGLETSTELSVKADAEDLLNAAVIAAAEVQAAVTEMKRLLENPDP